MARAIVAQESGHEYQRLVLWKYINYMLNGNPDISCIKYEYDEIKSFDDIVIEYAKPLEYKGKTKVKKEYVQVKYHLRTEGLITWEQLINPKYINAKKCSLMDKVKDAYLNNIECYDEFIFTLYTTDEICQQDTLFKYRENRSGFIDVDKFFDDTKTTDRAKDIKMLMDKLQLNREELKQCLSRLRIIKGEKIDELIDTLNIQFIDNGLKPIRKDSSTNSYVNLATKWLRGGTCNINKDFVLLECENEDLICVDNNIKELKIGVKTFKRNTEYLEQENIITLDLSNKFQYGRFIKDGIDWDDDIFNEMDNFCKQNIDRHKVYRLYLESSLTASFMMGRICNSTTGYSIVPVQKTQGGMKSWRHDHHNCRKIEEIVSAKSNFYSNTGIEDVIAISFSADIEEDVKEHIKDNKNIRLVINIKSNEITKDSISNGKEAWLISNYIYDLVKENKAGKNGRIHIYAAAPNVFMYYLGKVSMTLGNIVLYEYDSFRLINGTYSISAIFPMKGEF